jgi:hypothetical protein
MIHRSICACYLITGKVMKNFTRNKCTLDAIAVVEFTKNDTPMNWCQYLLQEMLQAYADIHERTTYFIYDYLLVTFAMWKWKPPHDEDLLMVQILALPSYLILGMLRIWLAMLSSTMLSLHIVA